MDMFEVAHTSEGETQKFVNCEKCGCRFYYIAKRVAEGKATSLSASERERLATKDALEVLNKQLEKAVDLVACPRCRHFQAHMITNKMWVLAWKACALSICVFLGGLVFLVTFYGKPGGFSGNWFVDVGLLIGVSIAASACLPLLGLIMFRPNDGWFYLLSKSNVDNGFEIPNDPFSNNNPKKFAANEFPDQPQCLPSHTVTKK